MDSQRIEEAARQVLVDIWSHRSTLTGKADSFAGYFLMPRKIVEEHFVARFRRLPFKFDYHAAYELGKGDPDSLLRPRLGQKARALALATARSYQGRHFTPLAEAFRVSALSISIQLEQLGLVDEDFY